MTVVFCGSVVLYIICYMLDVWEEDTCSFNSYGSRTAIFGPDVDPGFQRYDRPFRGLEDRSELFCNVKSIWIIITQRVYCGRLNHWFFTILHCPVVLLCLHEILCYGCTVSSILSHLLTFGLGKWFSLINGMSGEVIWEKAWNILPCGFSCLFLCDSHDKSMPWVAFSAWALNRTHEAEAL